MDVITILDNITSHIEDNDIDLFKLGFSLRIQDEKSKYCIEIANSSINAFNASDLIRLYNLIDKDSSSLNALIDDFLNS